LQIAVHCFGNFAVGGESLVEGRSLPVNVHLYERSHEFSPPISPSYRHARILLDGDTVRTELSWLTAFAGYARISPPARLSTCLRPMGLIHRSGLHAGAQIFSIFYLTSIAIPASLWVVEETTERTDS
jgi:hypothetical protein